VKNFSLVIKAAKKCRSPDMRLCSAFTTRRFSRCCSQHNLEYGTPTRKLLTVAKPLAAAGIAVAGLFALTTVFRKLFEKSERRN
jgi:hypothetical protein